MKGDRRHRVHVGFGDIFDDDWDIKVPCSNRLIIRSGDESSIIVNEGDGVDRPKMLIILLSDFSRVHVVLDDLLVHHAC